jgi:hypothetical protein
MKRLTSRAILAAVVATVVSTGASISLSQAPQEQQAPRAIPRMPDGKPDFSGFLDQSCATGSARSSDGFHEIQNGPLCARR